MSRLAALNQICLSQKNRIFCDFATDTANKFILPSDVILIFTCFTEVLKLDLLIPVNWLKYVA